MPFLFPAVSAVHLGCLVEALVNVGDGCQINDHSKSEALPQVGRNDDLSEHARLAEEENRINTEFLKYHVDDTVGSEDIAEHSGYSNPGKEMRQIRNGLRYFFELHKEHLVQKNRKCNCCDRSNRDVKEAYSQCVD